MHDFAPPNPSFRAHPEHVLFFAGIVHGLLLLRGIDFISISLAIVITTLTISGILLRFAKLRMINQFNRIVHTNIILSALLIILIILHVLIS